MKALTIRPYEPRYLQEAADLWFTSWRSTGLTVTEDVTADDLRDRIPREINAGWSAYLGWLDETLAGFLAIKISASCLDQLFILPALQGNGVGASLLDFAKSEMPGGMRLRTAADNIGARRFYERHGFRVGKFETHPRLGHQTVIYHWP